MPESRQPIKGFYPTPNLGHGRWLRVIATLRKAGTKLDASLADNIERQIERQIAARQKEGTLR